MAPFPTSHMPDMCTVHSQMMQSVEANQASRRAGSSRLRELQAELVAAMGASKPNWEDISIVRASIVDARDALHRLMRSPDEMAYLTEALPALLYHSTTAETGSEESYTAGDGGLTPAASSSKGSAAVAAASQQQEPTTPLRSSADKFAHLERLNASVGSRTPKGKTVQQRPRANGAASSAANMNPRGGILDHLVSRSGKAPKGKGEGDAARSSRCLSATTAPSPGLSSSSAPGGGGAGCPPCEAAASEGRHLLQRYARTFDPQYRSSAIDHLSLPGTVEEVMATCRECGAKRQMVTIVGEGTTYCGRCYASQPLLVELEKPSYKEPQQQAAQPQAYKRINHLNEWLSRVQGKEYSNIPQSVLDVVAARAVRAKSGRLNRDNVREVLKVTGNSHYYEHVPLIMYKISGVPPVQFGAETEERLRHMFVVTQLPYLKHCPDDRSNFLSYSYTFAKMLQLLGRHDLLPAFSLLKSREKMFQQENVWRAMCNELGWPFIPSV
jgi:Poxvirus Late Transcription Factor VLTF3 like